MEQLEPVLLNGIGSITVDGNGSIVLTDNITSYKAGGSTVTFDGAVVIKGDVTITTDVKGMQQIMMEK